MSETIESGKVSLNLEEAKALDGEMKTNYKTWVEKAPEKWKIDGFLEGHPLIVVTSRFGQNTTIRMRAGEREEAEQWEREHDFSKLAYVTVALVTSIEFLMVERWVTIPAEELSRKGLLYNKRGGENRCWINLATYLLTTNQGEEIPIYDTDGQKVEWREAMANPMTGACAVFVNLETVQGLFNPDTLLAAFDDDPEEINHFPDEEKANGVPHCLYPTLTKINLNVRNNPNPPSPMSDREAPHAERRTEAAAVVKPVRSQMYNYFSHQVTPQPGTLDAQQGKIMGAITGKFIKTVKDKLMAKKKLKQCNNKLPFEVFHWRLELQDCPTSCHVEVVYAIDIRNLKESSGRYIFSNIIAPLANVWEDEEVHKNIKKFFIVLKPKVFPALLDWVAYPITSMMKALYDNEKGKSTKEGNAAVLATSLMHPLGLSKGIVEDSSPMLLDTIFEQRPIASAMRTGFKINMRDWPKKDSYPAVASKQVQEVSYMQCTSVHVQCACSVRTHLCTVHTHTTYRRSPIRGAQGYQAKLRISYFLAVDPTVFYKGALFAANNMSIHVAMMALSSFFDDTCQLVSNEDRPDCFQEGQGEGSQGVACP
ncbi:hypothetical protein EI94DRAFT_1703978 [Lactarius quietus]|nr:hypothetical protein EI94DRAFT_1703978 [Lactarius quietus]